MMLGKGACAAAETHHQRKLSMLYVVMRWAVLYSLGGGVITLYHLAHGTMTPSDAHKILAAALIRLAAIGFLFAWKPRYPVGNIIFLVTMVLINVVSIFVPSAVSSGRYMLYLFLPLVTAIAILPPWTMWIVVAVQVVEVGVLGTWHGITVSAYGVLSYLFIAIVLYLAGACMHSMIDTLSELRRALGNENEVRRSVIEAIANGNGGSKEPGK